VKEDVRSDGGFIDADKSLGLGVQVLFGKEWRFTRRSSFGVSLRSLFLTRLDSGVRYTHTAVHFSYLLDLFISPSVK